MALLEITNLKKAYKSPDGEVLNIIDIPSFTLDQGERLALHGASGSGKTTFLNLIAGILKGDTGSITLSGSNLTDCSESRRDQIRGDHVGYIFQTFNLLQGYTALENVIMGLRFSHQYDSSKAKKLLDRVGLKDRMNYKPNQLSVGQQQRVAVARALAKAPKLVLADEPTGNLDFRRAKESLDLIREMCQEAKSALILVSHDRDILAQFDNIKELSKINQAAV